MIPLPCSEVPAMTACPPETEAIEYKVRVSPRAKRLQLRIDPLCEVEVVLPHRMSPRHVPPFIEQHRNWILETKARLLRERGLDSAGIAGLMPSRILLQAIGQSYVVCFRKQVEPGLEIDAGSDGSSVIVEAADERSACRLLQEWLGREARNHLPPWLQVVSAELNIGYEKVSIRAQKTRWGSCSSKGTISLNRALLFLEPGLVRYLMIHELCHRVHMNHSPAFWGLVKRFAPEFREHERRLARAAHSIPLWSQAIKPE